MQSPANVPPKKVYQPPKLQVYGDLMEMTKASGNRGKKDGGTMAAMTRTG